MNRRFNPRFTLALVLVLGALGGGLYFLQGYQVTANAGTLKARADKAEADGDLWKAVSYLERYLGFRPADKETATRHAVLMTKAAKARPDQQRAYLALEQVLKDRPTDTELRRKAADLALAIDRPADAKFHFDDLLKGKPRDAELLEKIGLCEEQTGRLDLAMTRFEQAVAADPTRVQSYVRLAVGYRRQDRPAEADKVMDRLVAANPKSSEANLAKSVYERDLGRVDAAAKAIKDAQGGTGAGDPSVILTAAELAAQQGRLDDARAEYERGRKLFPDNIRFVTGQVTLDLMAGRKAAAVEALKVIAQKERDKPDDIWLLADLFITAGEPAEARKLMAKLSRQGPVAAAVEFLDGRLLFDDQKWAAATAVLTKCRAGLIRAPDVALRTELMLAACYERLDRPDKRLEAAQSAVKIDPTAVAARLALADARLAIGNPEEALTGYLQLAPRVPAARFAAAWLMIWQNRVKGSTAEWVVIDRLLADTPAADKKSPDFRLVAAALASAQGKRTDAKKVLEGGRADDPKERRYWIGLANLAGIDGGPVAAEKVLDEATAAAGDGADFRLARLPYRVAKGAADRLKPLEAGADMLPPADRERLFAGLADAYTAAGAGADALRLLDELIRQKPDNLTYQLRRFDRLAADGDPDKLTAVVDALRKLEGDDGAGWLYADAVRLSLVARRGTDPTATTQVRSRLAEVATRRPSWPTVPLLEAELDERAGNPDAAIDHYLRAIRLGAKNPAVVRRAAGLLLSRRRFDEARQLLTDAPTAVTPALQRLAAELAVVGREGDPDSLRQAALAVPADTKEPADELWRGLALWAAGQPADAEKAFRRAVELGGVDPTNWGALVRFLAQTDRKADALKAIEEAKGKVAADQLPLSLAQWHDMIGDRAEAAKLYDAAYRKAPGDPRVVQELALFHVAGGELDKAEPLLRGLFEKAADPAAASWARRTLALVLASKGEYKLGTEAVALIDANLKERPDSPEDKRAQAVILATRPGARRQAIQTLESSFARLRPTPSEEFLLAQLYDIDGNWPRSKERLLGLMGSGQAKNVQYLAYLILALLRHKEVEAAADWLARLEAVPGATDSPRTVELKARVLAARDKGTEATDLLTGFAEKLYKTRPNPGVYRAVGLLLAELKQPAAADGMLRKYVAQAEGRNPAVTLDLAEFQARQNRVADALEVVSKAAARGVAPEVIGRATVAVVRLGKATEADYAKAADLIAAARRTAPGSVDLQVSTADLLDARGQYDAAIAAYREILTRDPARPLALNNLSWLLTLHEKKADEGTALADQAIAVVGPVDIYLDTRGVAHLRAGRPEQAVRDFTAALDQSQRPDTLFHLALAYEKLGSTADTRRWFKKAVDAGLADKDVHPLELADYKRLQELRGK